MSVFRLKALAQRGDLEAKKDFSGREKFNPTTVEDLRRRAERAGSAAAEIVRPGAGRRPTPKDGATAARAFRMFLEGRELRDVVLELEQTPEYVAELRRQYAVMGRDMLISPEGLEEIRELLDWRGPATERSLLGAISSRMRHQFQRGRELGAGDEKHQTEGVSSGKTGTGDAAEGGSALARGEGPV